MCIAKNKIQFMQTVPCKRRRRKKVMQEGGLPNALPAPLPKLLVVKIATYHLNVV